MRRSRVLAGLVATSIAAAGLVAGGALASPAPAQALTASQATSSYDSFISKFWDPTAKYFYTCSDHLVHSEHAVDPQGGKYTDYWWGAQLWEMVMDRYQRTGDSASRAMIDDVFAGFQAAYPDFKANDWNDDMGWWAKASARAYELTGETKFLDESKNIFAYISTFEDTTYGGGIWWKNVNVGNGSLNEKNVATNGTAIATALRLYADTGDATYRDTAERLYTWLDSNFNRSGHIRDHVSGTGQFTDYDWTYNQGQFAEAALQMYVATGTASYLTESKSAIDWAVSNLTSSGTFLYEGDVDTAGFKAILTRDIRDLITAGGQTQYKSLLTANASQIANHVNSDGIGGYDWTAPTPALATQPVQSLGAGAAVAIMQQALPDNSNAIVEGSGVYEAENAVRNGVNTESTNTGYTGRGYLAGWNSTGTSVTFNVNVNAAGTYPITFRYAAAAGDASRQLIAPAGTATTITFPSTGNWTTWSTITAGVTLVQGSNAITLKLDTSAGNAAYLNLDNATIDLNAH
ncbi:glycoside hydrolase family 76 protein [Glaciihabitans sp. UYNi722]|uniref:glycoside hydrolase family 76 protein n=1 Tax=Glaciihabitans sp. UYNi722 TaxID=3156344 RepID=UPI00339492C8